MRLSRPRRLVAADPQNTVSAPQCSALGNRRNLCPTILPNPSAPSVKDLGKHADTVCAAIESMNLTDQRSIVIGVMIASLLSADSWRHAVAPVTTS
jgi:hypothetical protein